MQSFVKDKGGSGHILSSTESDLEKVRVFENYQAHRLTLKDLLRQKGLGIKIRFLIALTVIAVLPAVVLILILGDPSGHEQRGSLAQTLALQAQAQSAALDQAIELRQSTVTHLAANPSLAQILPGPVAQTQLTTTSPDGGLDALRTIQQSDPSSLAWIVLRSDGTIAADGSAHNTSTGRSFNTSKIIDNPIQLAPLLQADMAGKPSKEPMLGIDPRRHLAWLALAAPLPGKTTPRAVLLAIFSVPTLASGIVATSTLLNGEVAVLLDQNGNGIASAGTLTAGQHMPAPMSARIQSVVPGSASPSIIAQNPLTGTTDLAVSTTVATISGRYVLMAPQDTQLVPSNRVLFAGRNTPLLILVILVAVMLVATGVALPIVRPIRRATRRITSATGKVRQLADDARRISHEHSLGTSILRGANKRLSGRRQSIIRDSQMIQYTCVALWPRLNALHQIV